MTTFAQEFIKAARETPRLYFAPLVGALRGAFHGAIAEYDRVKVQSSDSDASSDKAAK
jgi:hypothetical protein